MVLLIHDLPLELKPSIPIAMVDWILGRDGFQCRAPGCSRRENLEVHQIYPNHQGTQHNPANLVTVCAVCRPIWDLMGRGPFQNESAEINLSVHSA